jgi:hypothetical protein
MASIHIVNHSRRINLRERCTVQEIRIMRTMRFNGYSLSEIALMTDRTQPCVWRHTADIYNARWCKDRVTIRETHGGLTCLVANGYRLMSRAS